MSHRQMTVRTPKRRLAFLKKLREGASIYEACRHIGVSRNAMYQWRADDEDFHNAWDEAVEEITDAVEARLCRDARNGNTIAQIFWLKTHRPSVYNQRPAQAPPYVPGATINGDTVISPLGAPPEEQAVNNVMFRLPRNNRDLPEPLTLTHQPEPQPEEKPKDEEQAA